MKKAMDVAGMGFMTFVDHRDKNDFAERLRGDDPPNIFDPIVAWAKRAFAKVRDMMP